VTQTVDPTQYRARVLDSAHADDAALLRRLRADPQLEIVDGLAEQNDGLRRLNPSPDAALLEESARWVHYPWRRTLIHVLGPRAFRRLRLDRNRNLITAEEQDRLATLRVGVVGLSVGHAVAYTLAAQGVCGKLKLVDSDSLELSNLNRVPATVFDLGVNKAVAAARRIAELDPYLAVDVMSSALSQQTIDDFLDGVDVVAEECDSLDMKVLIREAARGRRLPVVMATSDRGLVDVERYDTQPSRPVLHGLLGDTDAKALSGLTSEEKIPHVLRVIDAERLSARGAASLIEVGHSLSTWPQLAGDVAVGAAAIVEAVRRIGLGEALSSGRVSIDVSAALDRLAEPARADRSGTAEAADEPKPVTTAGTVVDAVAAAAILAPSGGNAQPWRVTTNADSVVVRLEPHRLSAMDVGFRASAVAVGAAAFNARVAASAHDVLGDVTVRTDHDSSPLEIVIGLDGRGDPRLSDLYDAMLCRETNRHHGSPGSLDSATAAALQSAAVDEGGTLRLLTGRDDVCAAAAIMAEADRIRYLTPRLHADMVAELCWEHDDADTGIDVRSLELGAGERVLLDILRRPDVMARLAAWDAGAALGADTRARVRASTALGAICVRGRSLADYARGGSVAEAVWITAERLGLAVQPMSPVFLYAQHHSELVDLSSRYATALAGLRTEFRRLVGVSSDDAVVLVIRLFTGPRSSVRSRRRGDTIEAWAR
jgi:molybdopterin/thiamine biosynthesis adenylyltransferase